MVEVYLFTVPRSFSLEEYDCVRSLRVVDGVAYVLCGKKQVDRLVGCDFIAHSALRLPTTRQQQHPEVIEELSKPPTAMSNVAQRLYLALVYERYVTVWVSLENFGLC